MTTEPKHTPWAWADGLDAENPYAMPQEHREAFDRIVKQLASVQVLTQQRDALHAENERLREALRCLADVGKDLLTKQLGAQGFARLQTAVMDARAALSATENKSTTP